MSKTQKRAKPFKGWDYTELAERWNISINQDDYNKDKICDDIANYMAESLSIDENDKKMKKVASDLRKFLNKLADCEDFIGYYSPLWRGLAAIENDECLIKASIPLIPKMWS